MIKLFNGRQKAFSIGGKFNSFHAYIRTLLKLQIELWVV